MGPARNAARNAETFPGAALNPESIVDFDTGTGFRPHLCRPGDVGERRGLCRAGAIRRGRRFKRPLRRAGGFRRRRRVKGRRSALARARPRAAGPASRGRATQLLACTWTRSTLKGSSSVIWKTLRPEMFAMSSGSMPLVPDQLFFQHP